MTGIDLPVWLQALIPVIVFLVGAGTLGKWFAGMFRDVLRTQHTRLLKDDFASTEEFNGLRSSLEGRVKEAEDRASGAIRAAELANEVAEKALALAESTRTNQLHFQERLVNEVFEPIKQMGQAQKEQGETLAAATALLGRLTQQVDNMSTR